MNSVILMGRLTRDPEIRYAQQMAEPLCIARYTLAVDRRRRNQEEGQSADFISCTAFGHNAEFANKYLRQGTKIVLSGHIQTGSYTNRDGQKVYTTDVVVDSQEFAESKVGQAVAPQPEPERKVDADGFMAIPDGIDEELPFN